MEVIIADTVGELVDAVTEASQTHPKPVIIRHTRERWLGRRFRKWAGVVRAATQEAWEED